MKNRFLYSITCGDELVIQVRNQRKNLFGPRFLADYAVAKVGLQQGWL